jgi:hypothetical protein
MSQIIPLTSQAHQTLTVDLTVDGNPLTLQLDVHFSEIAGYWILAVSNFAGTLLLDSIPMLTGVYPAANILGQFAYLAIGSAFVINASGVDMDSPDNTNLGVAFILLWDDTPGYLAAAA